MIFHRDRAAVLVLGVLCAAAACDKDPAAPTERLLLQACPATAHAVNAPIDLTFNVPVLASTVQAGNVVVSDATTGIEIPGALSIDQNNPAVVHFAPASPFRFSQAVRVRIQNLRSAAEQAQIDVTACEFITELPPITQLYWRSLPHAGGLRLVGASLTTGDTGYVMSQLGVLFKRSAAGDFTVVQQNPYFNAGFDVSFVTPRHGFATWDNNRGNYSLIMESTDGGTTFDSIGVIPVHTAQRAYFRARADTTAFGVVGGGNTGLLVILKWHPETRTFTRDSSSAAGYATDIDFAAGDTTKGALVTNGIRVGSFEMRGTLWVTNSAGATGSWQQKLTADSATLTYFGVAVRNNGDIFVAGGNGYFARISPSSGYSETRLLQGVLTSFNPADPFSLIFTDVQFAPNDDRFGWLIGAQQIGVVNNEPRYQGVIFMTTDGGATWTRQGVFDAPNYGAEFARLNRLSVLSSTKAWIAGDGGTVLTYQPTAP